MPSRPDTPAPRAPVPPTARPARGPGFDEGDWPAYFDAVAGKPPRDTLLKALELFGPPPPGPPPLAIDLGCGQGRDTLELLRRGWSVLAIDGHPDGIARLVSQVDPQHLERLQTAVSSFADARWEHPDLVNASFSLPFCDPASFASVWDRIVRSLRPGGRFAGQLFGDRDEWTTIPSRTHHTRDQVNALLAPFTSEMLDESEKDGQDALGNPKHWHCFHIVARKT